MNRMKLVLTFLRRNPIISFVMCHVFPSYLWMLHVTLPVDAHRVNATCLLFDHESIYLWRVSPLKCCGGVSRPPSSRSSSVCLLRLLLLSWVGGNHAAFVCVLKPVLCFSSFLCCPGRVRTRRQSSGSTGGPSAPVMDSRGRSRAKVVSQSQRMYIDFTSVDAVGLIL